MGIGLAAVLAVGGWSAYRTQAAPAGAAFPSAAAHVNGIFARRIVEKLGLSDDQVVALKKVRNAEKDTVIAKLSELHQARKQLRSTIQSEKYDEAAVRSASRKVAAVESDLAVERAKIYAKVAPVLTDAQRAKIRDFEASADQNVEWLLKNIGSHPALND
ncbi:MAG: Spy/CpxP family protein refolding chaperone [Verrucomicrobiae bacterium]|nr:Spy/CpxP family protein refolding chaperone [Verrucomicrobiae bacterium]